MLQAYLAKLPSTNRTAVRADSIEKPADGASSSRGSYAACQASAWSGVGAPKNTPAEIIEKLNKEINAGLADPKLKARFADLGATMFPPGSPTDFSKLVADDTEKWGEVIRAANIKVE